MTFDCVRHHEREEFDVIQGGFLVCTGIDIGSGHKGLGHKAVAIDPEANLQANARGIEFLANLDIWYRCRIWAQVRLTGSENLVFVRAWRMGGRLGLAAEVGLLVALFSAPAGKAAYP